MGNIISAQCQACNFEKEFNFGGNMMDFTTNNPVPAIHKKSGIFRNVNYFRTKSGENYLYYFDNILKGDNKGGYTFQNFDLLLNEKGNYCPSCKKFSLGFILITIAD
jgi:hypothetical protein